MTDQVKIHNERVFAVDRVALFGAFADPAQLAEWWGPEGFTNAISAFGLKLGGRR